MMQTDDLKGRTGLFLSFVQSQRRSRVKNVITAILTAVLISALLYETQWLSLRPGLIMLLIGQLGSAVALVFRNMQASNEATHPDWFEAEERFLDRLALFDSISLFLGFLALGYAFWVSTESLWLSIAIGIVYPAAFYFGVTRRRRLEAIKKLAVKKQQLGLSL